MKNPNDFIKVEVITEVPKDRIEDILCNAIESGGMSNFRIVRYIYPEGQTKESLGIEFAHIQLPFKGGTIVFDVPEDDDGKEYFLDEKAMIKGIRLLARRYPRHFTDFIQENDDFYTGDCFLQLALLGEVVYA